MGIQSSVENQSAVFKLGSWTVEPLLNRLSNGGRVIPLEPKVMRLLICLAAKEGQVLTREVLLEQVWDNLAVVDSAIGRAVCQLRKRLALADGCQADVETIRQVGFRLVCRTGAPITIARTAPFHLSGSPAAAWGSAAVAMALAAFLMVGELSERAPLRSLDLAASSSVATTPTGAAESAEGPSTIVQAPEASGGVVQAPRGSPFAGSPDILVGPVAPKRGDLRSERSRQARAERMAERLENRRRAAEFRRIERETSGLSSAGSRAAPVAPAAPPPPQAPAAPAPESASPPPLPERSLS